MATTFTVATSQTAHFVDITDHVLKAVADSKVHDGLVVVYVPHTTAGITINENADPTVQRDILTHLDKMIPPSGDYRHAEGNSPAHIKASLMGSSVTVIVAGGDLQLGKWQGIYLCEFDGPRRRRVQVKIIEGSC